MTVGLNSINSIDLNITHFPKKGITLEKVRLVLHVKTRQQVLEMGVSFYNQCYLLYLEQTVREKKKEENSICASQSKLAMIHLTSLLPLSLSHPF